MAKPPCSICEQYEALTVTTNLESGEVVCSCVNCLPGYALQFAVSVTDGMPPDIAEVYAEPLNALSALLPASPPESGTKRRKASATATATLTASDASTPATAHGTHKPESNARTQELPGLTDDRDASSQDDGIQSSQETDTQA